ncbi:hypothetical protein HHX47_DHR1001414 [Lentinula edodes]|nr:hypothetical protein HHX47_DHR1001414 [Lentinula edodes]
MDSRYTEAFAVFGLTPEAEESVTSKAYKRLALMHHPDRNPGKYHESTQMFQEETCQEYYSRKNRPSEFVNSSWSRDDDVPLDPEEAAAFFQYAVLNIHEHGLQKIDLCEGSCSNKSFLVAIRARKRVNIVGRELGEPEPTSSCLMRISPTNSKDNKSTEHTRKMNMQNILREFKNSNSNAKRRKQNENVKLRKSQGKQRA